MYNIEESISNHEQSTNNDGGVLVGNSNMNIQVSSAMDAGDLLSAVVSQSAIDTHNVVIDGTVGTMAMDNLQMLQPMTDFSSLVGMEDIQISGDEILVQSDGNLPEHQTMLVHHPNVVGNNIEISSNQQTSPILIQQNHQPQLQHQQQSYPSSMVEVSSANILTETIPAINSNLLTTTIEPASPEPSQQLLQQQHQQQQQMNISLSSDVAMGDDMSELTIHEVHQSSSKSIPQTQGTLLPTIVTPNTAHIIAAAAAAQQPTNTPTTSSSAQTKTQVMNFPKLTLATTTQSQVQMAPIKITTTGTSVQQQQQPIFVTNQFLGSGMSGLQAGNISYILPPNTNFGKQTIAMKPGSGPNLASLGNATFVINQMPTGSKSGASSSAPTANLKLVQTSQGQQLILAAPFKPLTSTSSMGSLGSPKGSNQPISVKSAPTAQKGIPTIQFPAGSQAQLIGTSQNAAGQQQQQLIILSPVKQSPVVQSKQSTFAMPAMKLFSQGPSTSGSGSVISSKLQQIAPAPSKSQRVLAPAPTPILANKSAISITSGTTKPIQTLVHSNAKNVQYISFVPVSGAMSTSVSSNPIQNQTQAKLISSVAGGSTATKFFPLKPNSTGLSKPMIGTAGNSNATLKPNMVHLTTTGLGIGAGGTQKVLINPNTIKISTTVPSGTNMLTSGALASKISTGALNNSGKPTSIWMLPKQHVIKVESGSLGPTSLSGSTFQIQTTKPLPTACTPASKFVPIAPNPHQSSLNAAAGSGALQEHKMMATNTLAKLPPTISSDSFAEEARRKPCNCTRSQCLKLYCDCFANGEFCNNCNCVSCCNNLMHEEIRQKAIRLCLDRNPNAFHPKIGQNTHHGDGERKHTKGCCCKRSGCLKNYCECYEAKILCSDKCKCVGCKNFEESTERKTLMHLADAAEFRSVQQAYTSKVQIWGPDLKLKLPVKVKSDCHPFNIFTMDILEATACCMLAQAEEGEYENYSEENVESLILDQFGECFSQILNMASNNGMQDEIESDDEEQPNSSSQQNSSQQSTTDDQYHHNNELFERT